MKFGFDVELEVMIALFCLFLIFASIFSILTHVVEMYTCYYIPSIHV
jgi:hypothetical protein